MGRLLVLGDETVGDAEMLIGRYKETEIFGGSLAAVAVSGELMKIFTLSGLNKIIDCYDNARLALAALRGE